MRAIPLQAILAWPSGYLMQIDEIVIRLGEYRILAEFMVRKKKIDRLVDKGPHCLANGQFSYFAFLNEKKGLLYAPIFFLLWCMIFLLHAQDIRKSEEQKASTFTVRASVVDDQVKSHPDIDFLLEKNGIATDWQYGSVDLKVPPRGELMIWLMPYKAELFERVNRYGIHAIHVHYANQWFARLYGKPNLDPLFLSRIRLEAATGEDYSKDVTIPYADGVKGRAVALVQWLKENHAQGKWEQFLSVDGNDLQWDKVILAGSSHGATTAARFAKHQRVGRVVMFAGPRDQHENWQALPSATPAERYFGFTHELDEGWQKDHYCRSWELLGLHQFGDVVNVDGDCPPFDNSRRLLTKVDMKGNANRAHSCVTPGRAAVKAEDQSYIHEEVWRYLFTHPVDHTGQPMEREPDCDHHQHHQ